jgi:hypothetical protein
VWAAAADGGTRSTIESISTTNDQIMLALIGLVSMAIAALVWVIRNGRYLKTAAEEATAASAAVNNVGSGDHKMYDMVRDTKAEVKQIQADVSALKRDQAQFDSHGWETLPPDLGTAVGLTTTIRGLQSGHAAINGKLDTLIAELREHVAWEMDARYGKHGNP